MVEESVVVGCTSGDRPCGRTPDEVTFFLSPAVSGLFKGVSNSKKTPAEMKKKREGGGCKLRG